MTCCFSTTLPHFLLLPSLFPFPVLQKAYTDLALVVELGGGVERAGKAGKASG